MTGQCDADRSDTLLEQVQHALAHRTALRIQGGNSKACYGRLINAQVLDTRPHRGIVNYDPTELVITARAGTPLRELTAVLDEANQMLPCEPPYAATAATVGGMVAAGISGPRRPWAGSVRDHVLGTRVITGHGKHLHFGGEVMKNVAGYDISRLMAASLGCLGLITEVSLKVLPKPRYCISIALEIDSQSALQKLAEWGQQPLPISGASHDGQVLRLRLEGGEGSVKAAHLRLGGEVLDSSYWNELNDHRLPFFSTDTPLWRLSVPHDTPLLTLPGEQLLDWGAAQRWLRSDADELQIKAIATRHGGHATCYRGHACDQPFSPLPPTLMRYHQQLKAQLDPQGIFNPGRMYAEF